MFNNPGVLRGVYESLISKSMMGLCASDFKGGGIGVILVYRFRIAEI